MDSNCFFKNMRIERAFTIIELLVVIAIIGVLASIVLVSLSGTRDRAQIAKTLLYSNQVYHALGSDVVGNWNFDEGSGTTALDSSGYGNHGTISGGATYTTDTPHKAAGQGAGKYALSFDGSNDYVSLPTAGGSGTKGNLGFADTDDFTLSIWYNGSDTGAPSLGKALIGRDNTDLFANFILNGGYAEYIHYNSGWLHNIKSLTLVANNQWHYIVYVNHSNETGDLYVDGTKEINGLSSSISSATNYFKADNLMRGYSNQYTSGIIDEVRIYSAALTSAEIQKLYAEGLERHQNLAIK
jgi:prepilin-type N-terminal cleavage/methylation domain-containing protein